MENEERRLEIDILTLVAISIVSWALVVILHEIVGHAGSAALMGIPVRAVSSTTGYLLWDQIKTIGEYRIIHIGGTFVNFLTGAIAFLVLRYRKPISKSFRYFLWLFTTFSFVIVIMYLFSATAAGGGDWIEVIRELKPRNLYLAIIIFTGLLFALPGYALPLRAWMPDLRGNRSVLLKITAIPVLTLIITQTLSVLRSPFANLPPESSHLTVMVFVYIHFVIWAILVNAIPVPRSSEEIESIGLRRSSFWLVAGIIVFLFFVLILGPGLGPLGEDPRLM